MNKLIPQVLAASFVFLLSITFAQAADDSREELTRLLKLRLGTDQVQPARETGVEGVYQTRFGDKFAYIIEGGRYVFIGDMVDLKMARNMTEMSRRELVVEELAGYSEQKQIVFPAANEELAVLNVFTDTSCPYCEKLHSEVKYLQEAGISVHYFPYPRGGNRGPGYAELKKVWCAEDPLNAMNIAKGTSAGTLESSGNCESAQYVDDGFLLGNRIGVTGTPALYTSDGAKFSGYVPYRELIPQLIDQ
ncbi:MAG: DsbC family protein [Gammaproteobacteria bacterium]|nr:DsbC family protein [Gammaproteobacteria bacterium]